MSYTPNNAWDKSPQTGLASNPGPFLAEVMRNDDPLYSGRLLVYIPDFGGDPAQESSWQLVRYMTPYYGIQPLSNRLAADDAGQHESYGMWMTPPDLGVKVLVMFINGDRSKGVWMGCLPEIGSHGAIPGNDKGDFDVFANQSAANSDIKNIPRPEHSTAPTFDAQGLGDDPKRGKPITTSSLRESPTKVFGMNTPRGHSFFMDDGDTSEENKMLRIRTAGGNMIMMNDDDGFVYIINSAGTGWIELSPSGHIDMYGQSGISFATDGDINMHASGNINMHANQNAKVIADREIKLQGSQSAKVYGGSLSLQGNNAVDIYSCGEFRQTANQGFQFKSGSEVIMEGKCFKWNSGGAAEADQVSPESSANVTGYNTTVTRAPNKEPWVGHDGNYKPPAAGVGAAPNTGTGNAGIVQSSSGTTTTGGTTGGQLGVYIIGDSHTKALGGVNNFAVNGARLSAISSQANNIPPNSQVVMSGGHNDVAFGSSASQIATRVQSIVRELQSKKCEVTYILFPVGSKNPNQENMAPTRQAIRSAIGGVKIIDLEGRPMSSDGQHNRLDVYRNLSLPTPRQATSAPTVGLDAFGGAGPTVNASVNADEKPSANNGSTGFTAKEDVIRSELGNIFESISAVQDTLPIGTGMLNNALSIRSVISNVDGTVKQLVEPLTSLSGLLDNPVKNIGNLLSNDLLSSVRDTNVVSKLTGAADFVNNASNITNSFANLNFDSIADKVGGGIAQGISGIVDTASNLGNFQIGLPKGLTDIIAPDVGSAVAEAGAALGGLFKQDSSSSLSLNSTNSIAPNSSVGGSCGTPALRTGPSGNGPGDTGPPGESLSKPATSESAAINGVLNFIAAYESKGDYNIRFGGSRANLVGMTIAEVYEMQKSFRSWPSSVAVKDRSSAVGRYQYIKGTLEWMVGKMKLSTSTLFNEQTQDAIAVKDLRGRCQLDKWLAGQLSDEKFLNLLAAVWASIPNTTGKSQYLGVGNNKAGVKVDSALSQLAEIKTRVA